MPETCETCGSPEVYGGRYMPPTRPDAENVHGDIDFWHQEATRLASERNRLAAALKAEQHAHTETASEWHARFVKADQDRMALASHRERLEEALQKIEEITSGVGIPAQLPMSDPEAMFQIASRLHGEGYECHKIARKALSPTEGTDDGAE